jgi:hypothetical protein
VHDPALAAESTAARARGGANRRRATPAPPPPPPPSVQPLAPPFDLGRLDDQGDIARACLRVARALAAGQLDVRVGRVMVEFLRASTAAFVAAGDDAIDTELPHGAREATAEEMQYVIDHDGKFPPGVTAAEPTRPFAVYGEIWTPAD